MMDYTDYLVTIWEWALVLWEYAPWMAYVFALTLVPKVWRRTCLGAEEELKNIKFHRCYGADRCCHPLQEDEITRPRRKIIRRLPLKTDVIASNKTESEPAAVHSPPPTLQTHVNQIAKMFEGNARKVNRVTPIITNEPSSDHQSSEELVPKKLFSEKKPERPVLKNLDDRYFKPSPMKQENIPENDENSANVLNRPLEQSSIVIRRRRQPSMSPSPPSPRPLSRQSSRPNSLKASIENIFALANQCTKGSCGPSGPVTSIEEILSQRRLSRPLSAYSISDLLGDNLPDETYIESFFVNLNK